MSDYTEVVNLLEQVGELQEKIRKLESEKAELIEVLEWFCNRVESGEVRSKRTYNRFKELLNKHEEK